MKLTEPMKQALLHLARGGNYGDIKSPTAFALVTRRLVSWVEHNPQDDSGNGYAINDAGRRLAQTL